MSINHESISKTIHRSEQAEFFSEKYMQELEAAPECYDTLLRAIAKAGAAPDSVKHSRNLQNKARGVKKMTEALRERILNQRENGMSVREIAECTGAARSTVQRVLCA